MKRGLVLGKFYPLHIGHINLIKFASKNCDELIILICVSNKEKISGELRKKWIEESFPDNPKILPILLNYTEDELPNTSVSSRAVSKIWSEKIKECIQKVNVVFSSEKYGDYLAEYLNCRHQPYDLHRINNKISATKIRNNPFKYWDLISESARPYFVKKICLYGTESTGKSTLAKRLSQHFNTEFVSEMAREVIAETENCTEENLQQIALLHAKSIESKIAKANKILFVDTDLNITRSYSRFLFDKELEVPEWIEKVNTFDLYLFLNKDAPLVQDGTRLDLLSRNILHTFHLEELLSREISFQMISGNWEERFKKSVEVINKFIF